MSCPVLQHPPDKLQEETTFGAWWCSECAGYVGSMEAAEIFRRQQEKASDKCECGGEKAGYPRGNPGHAHWCKWRSK